MVGTAPKRSIVRVSAVGPGNVGVLLLGQTVADNAGNWNLQTRPLPDGPYVFTATINPPGQFPARSILLTNNGRFVVDTIGPRIVSVGVESVDIQADPTSANLILNLSDVGSGVSVAAAMNSGAYAVTASVRKARQAVLIGPQAVLSVDAVGGNATNVRVAMRFEGLRPNVRYRLHLAPGLIVDRAGNALLGASTIDFRGAPVRQEGLTRRQGNDSSRMDCVDGGGGVRGLGRGGDCAGPGESRGRGGQQGPTPRPGPARPEAPAEPGRQLPQAFVRLGAAAPRRSPARPATSGGSRPASTTRSGRSTRRRRARSTRPPWRSAAGPSRAGSPARPSARSGSGSGRTGWMRARCAWNASGCG